MHKNILFVLMIISISIFILPDVSAACTGNPTLRCSSVSVKAICDYFNPLCSWTGSSCVNVAGKSCSDATDSQCTDTIGCKVSSSPTCTTGVCCDNGRIAGKDFVCETIGVRWYCSGREIIYNSTQVRYCDGINPSHCLGLKDSINIAVVDSCIGRGELYGCRDGRAVIDNTYPYGDNRFYCDNYGLSRCNDNIDNDNDGIMDCADKDCVDALVIGEPAYSYKCADNDIWFYTRCGTRTNILSECGASGCVDGSKECNPGLCNVAPYNIDSGEVCDHNNLNGKTCEDLGMVSGTLDCNIDCTGYDTYGCCESPARITCGTGACERSITRKCTDGVYTGECIPGNPYTEEYNGIDDDCDGTVDDGVKRGFFGFFRLIWLKLGFGN